jgi:hypothetical protein
MAIELAQIHNVVRTYHQAIHSSLSELHEVERRRQGLMPAPGTCERNIMRVIREVMIVNI